MGAAITLRNMVGKAENVLVIAVVPLQGSLNHDPVALAVDQGRRAVQSLLVAVEIFDEGLDAALVMHIDLLRHHSALIGERDGNLGIEEGEFAQAVLQLLEVEHGVAEGDVGGQEGYLASGLLARLAGYGERRLGLAVAEGHGMDLAVAANGELETSG